MRDYIKKGRYGEALAASYLEGWGFDILHRNWKYRSYEIDIIASFADTLHFIEVKTRSSRYFGNPEESVSRKKLNHLTIAASEYLFHNPQWLKVNYDIISITTNAAELDLLFIQDVFDQNLI